MSVDPMVLLTILGMAAVTYLPRVAGVQLAGRFAPSEPLRAWLASLPGAILVAMVAPAVARGGPAEWVAACATLLVAWRTRSLLPSLMVGVGVVWLIRTILAG